MSTIDFNESQFTLRSRRILGEPEVPQIIRFLVTKGIVKTEKQAIVAMLVLVALIIAASVFIFRMNQVSPATIDPEYLTY